MPLTNPQQRRTVTEHLCDLDLYNASVRELYNELGELLEQNQEGSLLLDIEIYDDEINACVNKRRTETDLEFNTRISREALYKKQAAQREYERYVQLRKKYELKDPINEIEEEGL